MTSPQQKNRGGRPTKYTQGLAEAICKDIAQGNPRRVAALTNGIAESTFYEWCEHIPEFSEAVKRAEASAEKMVVTSLRVQMLGGDTKAIIFYLTHRSGDDWKPPKQETKVSGDPDAPLIVERVVFGKGE